MNGQERGFMMLTLIFYFLTLVCVFSVTKERRRNKEKTEREEGPLSFLKIFNFWRTSSANENLLYVYRQKENIEELGIDPQHFLQQGEEICICMWLPGAMSTIIKEEKLEGGRRVSGAKTPPEGGWGWMIVAACFLATICIRAVTRWQYVCELKCPYF